MKPNQTAPITPELRNKSPRVVNGPKTGIPRTATELMNAQIHPQIIWKVPGTQAHHISLTTLFF